MSQKDWLMALLAMHSLHHHQRPQQHPGAEREMLAKSFADGIGAKLCLTQVHLAGAQYPDQPDQDQVNRDDVVQHPGHHQDQNAGEKGDDRGKPEVEVHRCFLGCRAVVTSKDVAMHARKFTWHMAGPSIEPPGRSAVGGCPSS
jgi:hypothetical protein